MEYRLKLTHDTHNTDTRMSVIFEFVGDHVNFSIEGEDRDFQIKLSDFKKMMRAEIDENE